MISVIVISPLFYPTFLPTTSNWNLMAFILWFHGKNCHKSQQNVGHFSIQFSKMLRARKLVHGIPEFSDRFAEWNGIGEVWFGVPWRTHWNHLDYGVFNDGKELREGGMNVVAATASKEVTSTVELQYFGVQKSGQIQNNQGRCSKVRPHGKSIVLLRRIVFLCNFFSLYVLS